MLRLQDVIRNEQGFLQLAAAAEQPLKNALAESRQTCRFFLGAAGDQVFPMYYYIPEDFTEVLSITQDKKIVKQYVMSRVPELVIEAREVLSYFNDPLDELIPKLSSNILEQEYAYLKLLKDAAEQQGYNPDCVFVQVLGPIVSAGISSDFSSSVEVRVVEKIALYIPCLLKEAVNPEEQTKG